MEREEAQRLCERLLGYVKKGEAEVLLHWRDDALTRFACNQIQQHINRRSLDLTLRVLHDGRVGKASTNMTDDESLKACARAAEEMLPHMPQDPEQLPLPEPQDYRQQNPYDGETHAFGPAMRAERVAPAFARAEKEGVEVAGILSVGASCVSIANSKGLFAYHLRTDASFRTTVLTETSAGWAADTSHKVADINFDEVVERAFRKALESQNPRDVEPGEYDVVLEPEAVGELLSYMGWAGFGGLAFLEGRSFISGKIGQKVMDEKVTIHDDAYHPLAAGMPFDFEGMPRKSVTLIEKGIARAVVHSRKTAKKAGTQTTGHALPEPNAYGPIPLNPLLEAGDSSLEEMIEKTERGILVTQFHYTNLMEPMRLTMTGITRNGTFMIENGRIAYPVKNLRFTESLVKAFSSVEMVGRELRRCAGFFFGGAVVPALKVRNFRFTSVSESK